MQKELVMYLVFAPHHHLCVKDDEHAENDSTEAGVNQVQDPILKIYKINNVFGPKERQSDK